MHLTNCGIVVTVLVIKGNFEIAKTDLFFLKRICPYWIDSSPHQVYSLDVNET